MEGERELEFYRLVFSSPEPEHVQWRGLVPHFHGVQTTRAEDGELDQSIVFGNQYFLAPTGALEEGILSVRPSVTFLKRTLKMSFSSILKSPGGSRASEQASKHQVGRQARR